MKLGHAQRGLQVVTCRKEEGVGVVPKMDRARHLSVIQAEFYKRIYGKSNTTKLQETVWKLVL